MVDVLIRMKLAVLRHSLTDARVAMMISGGLAGLTLAAGTIALGAMSFEDPTVAADLLALVLAAWLIGWLVGPVMTGGQSVLRPEHFSLLPLSRARLAVGLLATAFVGMTTAIAFVAHLALLVYAARLGALPALVAVPAVLLQLTVVVLLSQVSLRLLGGLMSSRIGGGLVGVLTAAMLVMATSGWIVLSAVSEVTRTGFSTGFSATVRTLPSGWGLVAVEAADRSRWPLVIGMFAAFAAAIALLLAAWSRLFESSARGRRPILGSRRPERAPRSASSPVSRTAAVTRKELRSWQRDPGRIATVFLAPTWALMSCALPLLFESSVLLPWAGVATALMAAATSANLIGLDGTALWTTLVTPGAELPEVRGRQWAWLIVFAPLSVTISVVFTALGAQDWTWPWTLSLLPALLGGGAGLIALVGVTQLVPGLDPRAQSNPLDHGDTTAQGIVMLLTTPIAAAVPAAVVLAGARLDSAIVRWSGVPVGLATGILAAWWLGRTAERRLLALGPELLQLMRTGKPAERTPQNPATAPTAMPPREQAAFWVGIGLGLLALFPQGIVPVALLASESESRVWFVALYLPDAWQGPAAAAMIALGLACLGAATRLYRRPTTVGDRK